MFFAFNPLDPDQLLCLPEYLDDGLDINQKVNLCQKLLKKKKCIEYSEVFKKCIQELLDSFTVKQLAL